jgi:hypothetical protein
MHNGMSESSCCNSGINAVFYVQHPPYPHYNNEPFSIVKVKRIICEEKAHPLRITGA